MHTTEFLALSPEQKAALLIFKGELPDATEKTDFTFKLYFYKKFYFEEVINRQSNEIVETNLVSKFAHFKKYLMAIRSEKLPH